MFINSIQQATLLKVTCQLIFDKLRSHLGLPETESVPRISFKNGKIISTEKKQSFSKQ